MKRIYISGPMTGLPGLNFESFNRAAKTLRTLGHQVSNPAENEDAGELLSWEEYLRLDLIDMLKCDTVALLPGWESSKGAQLELHVAHRVGIEVVQFDSLLATLTQEAGCHA
ncbi:MULTISPECIES: DUF4406 domain-containing protein [unclassified Halomonas]|uniref:DUF4406 domain-containing protein n=1 Tax=unclassified Halomonas TaxID=2609666 RepID=UPI0020768C1D|nr:DUF4406 domain-containing protein [Halomonas sp. S3-1-8]